MLDIIKKTSEIKLAATMSHQTLFACIHSHHTAGQNDINTRDSIDGLSLIPNSVAP